MKLNRNLRAGVVELALFNGTDPSQQKKELQINLRTGNTATISNAMIPLVAKSVLDGGWGHQNESAHTC